jgi:hypothetical protein
VLRSLLLAACMASIAAPPAAAADAACPLPEQKEVLIVQLFFGQAIKGRGPVTPREWRRFVAGTVTPRFPGGFTVYDAYGQWLNPRTQAVGRERTKVIVIAAADDPVLRGRIGEVSRIYRQRFRQQSVGIVTSPGCGAF